QKFSRKMLWARLGEADLQGHGPPSNTTPTIAKRGIFVRSKLPLRIGKRCKRLVGSTRRYEPRTPLASPKQEGRSSARSASMAGSPEGYDTRDLKEAKALLEESAA